MGTFHCNAHGRDYPIGSKCPECRREEERARDDERESENALRHEEQIETLRHVEHMRANPGDYRCPECRYVSLLRGARRCPLCHGTIDAAYWSKVDEEEKAAAAEARRQAAELERERPARERAAELSALAAEKARADLARATAKKRRLDAVFQSSLMLIGLPLMYFLPLLSAWSSGATGKFLWMMFIPGLNWLLWIGFIIAGHGALFSHALMWTVGGVVLGFAIHGIAKEVL